MKIPLIAASIALGASLFAAPALAIPSGGPASTLPAATEQVQFFFGGRNYCWYDNGWHGPGFYWCGYSWRRGYGWGGGAGWHGWHHGGGGHWGYRGGGHRHWNGHGSRPRGNMVAPVAAA